MKNRYEYFECACHSSEHRLVFRLDVEDCKSFKWPPELYSEVHLQHYRNIFKRVWIAIKYVFGYRCKYGHFDCFTMKPEDADRFRVLIDDYITEHDEWVKELKEEDV